jgi:hypothetical protein
MTAPWCNFSQTLADDLLTVWLTVQRGGKTIIATVLLLY